MTFPLLLTQRKSLKFSWTLINFLVPYHCKRLFRMLLNQSLTHLNDATEVVVLEKIVK